VDRDGKVVWEVAANGAAGARRTESGTTLICLWNQGEVIEVDRAGKIVWSAKGMSSPRVAQKLPNGNVLVADNGGLKEYDKDAKLIWRHDLAGTSGMHYY
jgi:outer membrane protein assembly factor BamB